MATTHPTSKGKLCHRVECPHCGTVFFVRLSYLKAGRGKYCNQACFFAYAATHYSERFWAKVDKTPGHGPKGECWVWTGTRHPFGYGKFSLVRKGRFITHGAAHIVSYELTYGSIPGGLWVLHRCDNPPCVRPDHLFLGTCADNMRDMAKKGRSCSPLTAGQVRAIRERYAQGGIFMKELGKQYGIAEASVWSIIHRKTWRHLI